MAALHLSNLREIYNVNESLSTQYSNVDGFGESVALEERILAGWVLGRAAVSGSLGNAMVITALACHKSLRTKVRFFIINLALANFIYCSCTLPFSVVSIALDGWPLSEKFCVILSSVSQTLAMASTIIHVLTAVNCYVHIVKPVSSYRSHLRWTEISVPSVCSLVRQYNCTEQPHSLWNRRAWYDPTIDLCNMDRAAPSSLLYSSLASHPYRQSSSYGAIQKSTSTSESTEPNYCL
ncbi:alpha-1A adrenergic receptor-like [Ptychodera flava]|uniref:alpha-1A adrenergic receptor-like n=1 Tax=Ptychodera flava TaxID=63121 RepID=UPI003969E208